MSTTNAKNVQPGAQQTAGITAAASIDGASASPQEIARGFADPAADSVTGSQPHTPRDRNGRFGKGNAARLKHGRFSKAAAAALLPEQVETLAILGEREAALLMDLGGESELSTLEKDLARKYLQLDAIAEFNAPRMLASRASVRRDARDTFLSCIDRQLKIIGLLGSKRRQRAAGSRDIGEWLDQRERERQQQPEQKEEINED